MKVCTLYDSMDTPFLKRYNSKGKEHTVCQGLGGGGRLACKVQPCFRSDVTVEDLDGVGGYTAMLLSKSAELFLKKWNFPVHKFKKSLQRLCIVLRINSKRE